MHSYIATEIRLIFNQITNNQYLFLKLKKSNRDYDVYCSSEVVIQFQQVLRKDNIPFILIDYLYVKRYFLFGHVNQAVDLIIQPIFRYRIYYFKNISLDQIKTNLASEIQNNDWVQFQKNNLLHNSIQSKISLKSIIYYTKVIIHIRFFSSVIKLSKENLNANLKNTDLIAALDQMRVPFRKIEIHNSFFSQWKFNLIKFKTFFRRNKYVITLLTLKSDL